MGAVVADEAAAPVVEGVAVLAHAGHGPVAIVEEVKAEIPPADVDPFGILLARAADGAAEQAVGHVDPVVDAEQRVVDLELRVPVREPLEQDLAAIDLSLAVAVAEVKDVRGAGDDGAA